MSHLTRDQLSAMLDGALKERDRAERHLEGCATCRAELAALADADRTLAASLEHDPGEVYFEGFADRVAERIAAEARGRGAGARGRGMPQRRMSVWDWLVSPRGLAWAGSTVAVLVVAGIVWMQNQNARSPLTRPELMARSQQAAPAPPAADRAEPFAEQEGAPSSSADLQAGLDKQAGDREKTRSNAAPSTSGARAGQEASQPTGGVSDERAPLESNERRDADALDRRESGSTQQQRLRRTAAGEEAPVGPKRAVVVVPAPAAPQPGVADRVESQVGQLKERQAAPLGKSQDAAKQSELQGFAASPSAEGKTKDDSFSDVETRSGAAAPSNLTWGKLESLYRGGAPAAPPRTQPSRWPASMRALVTMADDVERRALAKPSVRDYEAAALLWERVLPVARTESQRLESARHIAWLRYQANVLEPTAGRRVSARTAVERYVEVAPAGAERETYRRLLETLR